MKTLVPLDQNPPIDGVGLQDNDIVVTQGLVKNRIPFSLKVVVFYLFLLFVILPSAFAPRDTSGTVKEQVITQREAGVADRFQRLPLVVGIVMVAMAFLTKRRLKGMGLPIALFLIFSCGYLFNGVWGPSGLLESSRLFFASTGIGMCLLLTIKKPVQLDFFLKALYAVALVNAIYGLLFTIPGVAGLGEALKSLGLPSGRDRFEWRLIGLLSDPSVCGLLLITGFIIALDRVLEKLSFLNIALALTFILAIFLTFSRTAWVGALAGIVFLLSQKKIATTKIALVFIFGGLFFLAAYNIFSYSISQNQFRWDLAHSDTRSGVWLFWSAMALNNPLGYGNGFIYDYVAKHSWQVPHNIYLSLWVEGGIQTLIPLLLLLWLCFRRQWRIREYVDPKTGKRYGPLLLSLFVAISISLLALSSMMQLLFITMSLGFSYSLLTQDGLLVSQENTPAQT